MTFDLQLFRKDIITKRVIEDRITMDEAVKQIGGGISKSTLSRIESKNTKTPDIITFARICTWLELGVSKYFY